MKIEIQYAVEVQRDEDGPWHTDAVFVSLRDAETIRDMILTATSNYAVKIVEIWK